MVDKTPLEKKSKVEKIKDIEKYTAS